LAGWLCGWRVDCLVVWLVFRLFGWLAGWLIAWLVGWIDGCLGVWLVGLAVVKSILDPSVDGTESPSLYFLQGALGSLAEHQLLLTGP